MTTILEDLTTQHCTVERDGHVVILTMNRPEKRNALSGDMLAGLVLGYEYIDENPDIRCAILTGAGGHFSSGADLVAMGQQSTDEHVQAVMARGNNPHWKALLRDYRLSKPLIAAVEGYAVAGGTEILQGTDIRVAGEGAIFGVWEAKRGLFPLGGSACRLPRQIPYTPAMDILLACRPMRDRGQGDRSDRRVVPDGTALEVAKAVAAEVAAARRCPPRRSCAWRETEHMSDADAMQHQDTIGWEVFASEDAQEGPARFRRKARARIQGPLRVGSGAGPTGLSCLRNTRAREAPVRAPGTDRRRHDLRGRRHRNAARCRRGDRPVTVRLGGRDDDGPGYLPRNHGDYLPRSPIVGEASPLSPRLDWEVDGEIDGSPEVAGRARSVPPTRVRPDSSTVAGSRSRSTRCSGSRTSPPANRA